VLTWSIVHRLSALVFLLVVNLLTAQQSGLRITIVEGDGAINNINQKVNVLPVVEVRDESGKLQEGAAVVFSLPTQGPGGIFSNGTNTLTATTDRQGRATASGIRLNRQTGKFDIRVTASLGGQTASATITQTNVSGVSTSGTGGSSKKIWILVAVIGGAAAIGALVAIHHGSSSSSSGPPPIVITPGTPSVGGPN
jgi:hypothetical protein